MATTQQRIAPPAHYRALFGAALGDLPGAATLPCRRLREESFARFEAQGFPGPKAEAWKYTQLAALAKLDFRLPERVEVGRADLAPFLIDDPEAIRLVFVNGRFAADLSDALSAGNGSAEKGVTVTSLDQALERGNRDCLDLLPEDDDERGLSALNGALAAGGCLIDLADHAALPGPVQLLFASVGQDQPTLISPRNLVRLGDGARLDLIESHITLSGGRNLTNLVNRIVVGRGAHLRHDRLQQGETAGSLIGRTEYRIAADARLTQSLATLGGGLVRNEIEALVLGSGVELQLNGLYLTRDRQHVDNTIRVDHARPGSVSDQFYKGVLDGQSHAVFAGKIVVRREAQKTNAYQANNNLLLSPDVEIDTKPELEIFADDVKCSHGATSGELDERELFYLRSRGLDPDTARSMLTFAFADEVIERFAHPAIAAQAKRELLRWLPGGAQLGELA
jgi:Fe-S cluster assembly protein SufD